MNLHSTATLAAGAAFVIAGVLIEGTQQNPWNRAMSYLLVVGAIQGLRRLPALRAWVLSTVVVGLAFTVRHGRWAPTTSIGVGCACVRRPCRSGVVISDDADQGRECPKPVGCLTNTADSA